MSGKRVYRGRDGTNYDLDDLVARANEIVEELGEGKGGRRQSAREFEDSLPIDVIDALDKYMREQVYRMSEEVSLVLIGQVGQN